MEPVGEVTQEAAEEPTEPPISATEPKPGVCQGAIRGGDGLFPHDVTELSAAEWKRLRFLLVGNQGDGFSYKEEPNEESRFVPDQPLERGGSILKSYASLMRAANQFTLPRDKALLRGAPSAGLHLALKSYLIRGALMEDELFSRLTFQRGLIDSFELELSQEREARAEAERKLAALAAEKENADGKWRREVETREKMVEGLRQHRSKLSADIQVLEAKNSRLVDEVDCLKTVVTKRDGRIKFLEEEVEMEKRHRVDAQESSWADRRALSDLQMDLTEERATHERLQADYRALEHRIAALESEDAKAEVVEAYRQSALGKVELALAAKAGFDYAVSRLPSESQPQVEDLYPSRVAVCLSLLKDIEERGGGITLHVEEDDEEEVDEGQSSATAAAAIEPPPEAEPGYSLPSSTPDSTKPTDSQAPLP